MKAWIISNGSITDYNFYKNLFSPSDLIICADGGAMHAEKMGIIPHILIGDMDSIEQCNLNAMQSKHTKRLQYPAGKDQTDTQLAVEYAIGKGCKEIVLIGSLGSRFDHSFANISLLKLILDHGINGMILNEHNEIYLINHRIRIKGKAGDILSLLPVSECVDGITTTGLQYALQDAQMTFGLPYGVSNVFTRTEAEISIKQGSLLVIKARD